MLKKKLVSHLRAFRMCVIKDSPEAPVFNHPGALTKLALWIGEALAEQEKDATGKLSQGGRGTPLVVASLNEKRGVYVVIGTGGGGGPDTLARDREAAKKKQEAKKARETLREQRKEAKQKIREEKRAAKGDADADEDETESEDSSDGESESDSEDDDDDAKGKGYGLNKFGSAFQEVVAETNTRMRIDSFEHCVVEVKKEDLSGFLESLSTKTVIG